MFVVQKILGLFILTMGNNMKTIDASYLDIDFKIPKREQGKKNLCTKLRIALNGLPVEVDYFSRTKKHAYIHIPEENSLFGNRNMTVPTKYIRDMTEEELLKHMLRGDNYVFKY